MQRRQSLWWVVLLVACGLSLVIGCSDSGTSDADNGGTGGEDAAVDTGPTSDTAEDSGPEDAGANDAERKDSSTDSGSDGSDGGSCEETWEAGSGEERCCGRAELSCNLLDFSTDGSASNFDPSTDVFTVRFDRNMAELVSASVSATITTGRGGGTGGGRFVSENGTLQGSTVTFDFSGYEFADDEVLDIDSISLEDACGHSRQLLIGNTVDPEGFSETTGFDCEPAPDF